MTDRELLELAAEAAGIASGDSGFWDFDAGKEWNPLHDDGDALRLAVKLKLELHFELNLSCGGEIVECLGPEQPDGSRHCATERVVSDPLAATRCAIVRAAANIAKEQT